MDCHSLFLYLWGHFLLKVQKLSSSSFPRKLYWPFELGISRHSWVQRLDRALLVSSFLEDFLQVLTSFSGPCHVSGSWLQRPQSASNCSLFISKRGHFSKPLTKLMQDLFFTSLHLLHRWEGQWVPFLPGSLNCLLVFLVHSD